MEGGHPRRYARLSIRVSEEDITIYIKFLSKIENVIKLH